MKHSFTIAALALSIAVLPTAAAQQRDLGLFLTAGGGNTKLQGFCEFVPNVIGDILAGEGATAYTLSSHQCENSESYYKFSGGYQFNDYFALELGYGSSDGYANSGSGTATVNGISVPFRGETDLNYSSLSMGVEARLPVNDWFTPLLRAGMHSWERDIKLSGTVANQPVSDTESLDGTDPYWGVGANFNFYESFSLGVEWTRYVGAEYDADTLGGYLKANF